MEHLNLPTIVLACKSDLEHRVDPDHATAVLARYDVGLVEVTVASSFGKDKMRESFGLILRAIHDDKRQYLLHSHSQRIQQLSFCVVNGGASSRDAFRNPASPAIIPSPMHWDISRASSTTPTASSTVTGNSPLSSQARIRSPRLPTASEESPRTPRTPMSPTRTRSMSDLLSERERQDREWEANGGGQGLDTSGSRSRGSSNTRYSGATEGVGSFDEANETTRSIASRES